MIQSEKRRPRSVDRIFRSLLFVAMDILCICASYFAALFLRFDFSLQTIIVEHREYLDGYLSSMPFWVISTVLVLYAFHLYHSVWSYVGVIELRNLMIAHLSLVPVYAAVALIMKLDMPASYYIVGFFFCFAGTVAIRFGYRLTRSLSKDKNLKAANRKARERVMIIGAGSAAHMIIQELTVSGRFSDKVCCAIDDNPNKRGRFIEGVEIVGDRFDIVKAVGRYDISKIIFAIPSCDGQDRKEILNLCKETGCKVLTVPGIYQLVNNEVTVRQLRDVEIEDLLGREPISVDNGESFAAIAGKVVLVTGGGGSIGSELCRQIARAKPKQLVILDIYENNAYEIQQELKRKVPDLDLVVLIGSVRNTLRMDEIMRCYRPNLVFHAAAHKHVPLMEDSPNEAIKNNVFGTYKTAVAAEKYGVEKFVLISTDKAVNPTNIMAASKRICEMVVQMMDRKSRGTRFVAVRFGNVLGSNGSVIPLFKKQIAQGGPVTITDKRIIRYFMTISEAVALVLQASCYAKGGEIFVLDMGEPVKIDDMARNLIRLSGLKPDVDIKIEYVGLRPGEKLYEELLMDEEGLKETENKLIHIGRSIEMDDELFGQRLSRLYEACKGEDDQVRTLVAEMVPTYTYKQN